MDESRKKDGVEPSGELRYPENRDAPAMRSRDDFHPGDVPATPGIYIFRDRFSKVIYVGKAANLRKRVSSYFQPSRQLTADPKLRSLINSIAFYETHAVKTDSESLLYESKMIKEYAPRYNVLLRDDKRFLLVKINLSEKFPALKMARLRKNDGHTYFGPFPKGGALKRTVEFLVRKFGLRICSSAVPGERDRKHCLAGIVKDCCEPCVGKATEEDYKSRIEKLTHIINGDVREIVSEIRELMAEAGELRRFEKAAVYRDVIENIETIFGKKNRTFRYARIPEEKNTEDALEALKEVLGLAEPPRVIEAFDISNISGSLAVASMVRFTNGRPDTAKYRRFRIRGETGKGEGERRREASTFNEEEGEEEDKKCSILNDQFSIFNEDERRKNSILNMEQDENKGSEKSKNVVEDYPLGRGGVVFAMMKEAVFRRYSRLSSNSTVSVDSPNVPQPSRLDSPDSTVSVDSPNVPQPSRLNSPDSTVSVELPSVPQPACHAVENA
ncbi:MAG: GIY-YIG nuclease family protein, partial [Victivallales bacterium]|nr:GIY-YIG nuclease family protein [Victivallales bacterium]